ncbi:TBC1 domain family member 5 [Porphyridium purpureum]|uniref:TBC1 domain family member 5 n=1 Tax=Porphyridium purpureum TaxID=35688 RepID=A0A5J4YUI8_PORPP|nr:TBC1 domain family member 5 [Porphyridium purpureum]|eukprot:POR2246..scf227_4
MEEVELENIELPHAESRKHSLGAAFESRLNTETLVPAARSRVENHGTVARKDQNRTPSQKVGDAVRHAKGKGSEDPGAASRQGPELNEPQKVSSQEPQRRAVASSMPARETNFHPHALPAKVRQERFSQCLHGDALVDVDVLARLVWIWGVPEDAAVARALTWKLLCGYLPEDRALWESTLAAKRTEYRNRVRELYVNPQEEEGVEMARNDPALEDDHPLSTAANSRWAQYFKDSAIRETINRDVKRTQPELDGFRPLEERLARILFVYARQRPKLSYKQGMNELGAVMLQVFHDGRGVPQSASSADSAADDAEADAFFCLEHILEEYARFFGDESAIQHEIDEFSQLLLFRDKPLSDHFARLKLDARFYYLRWLRLWLTQDFDMAGAVLIWDFLLSTSPTARVRWMRFLGLAFLQQKRTQLLRSDLSVCMKLLLHSGSGRADAFRLLRDAELLQCAPPDRSRGALAYR